MQKIDAIKELAFATTMQAKSADQKTNQFILVIFFIENSQQFEKISSASVLNRFCSIVKNVKLIISLFRNSFQSIEKSIQLMKNSMQSKPFEIFQNWREPIENLKSSLFYDASVKKRDAFASIEQLKFVSIYRFGYNQQNVRNNLIAVSSAQFFQITLQSTQNQQQRDVSSQKSFQSFHQQIVSTQQSILEIRKATISYAHKLTQLNKIYRDDDKFNKTKNNLKYKLSIFYDKCYQVDISNKTYHLIAEIMLSNFAQSHYFINRSTMIIWDEFIVSLKFFFENPEWKRMNMIRWQIINLNEIITINFIFSTSKYLTKLVIEIDLLQRKIESKMMKLFHLRKNIIRTIRGHSALLIELTVSSNSVSSLVNNLYSSIVNYEAVHKPSQQKNYV